MAQIQYIEITDEKCCGGSPITYSIPIGSTPHEIAIITGMPLSRAIELSEGAIAENNDECPTIYTNSQISESIQKNNCQFGEGTFYTVTIGAGMFSSQLSQQDADAKAQTYFDDNAQRIANTQGVCNTPNCIACTDFRIVKTTDCGEYRRNTECRNGECIDISSEYFICTGNCHNEVCIEDCIDCSATCPTGNCPTGYNCECGTCIADCEGAECSRDCPNNPCSDPCQECFKGQCIDKKCFSWEICQEGICVDKPCSPACTDTTNTFECYEEFTESTCVRGVCQEGSPINTNINEGGPCGTNQICLSGVCSDKPCIPVGGSGCPEGQCCEGLVCHEGTCVASCPFGYQDVNGICVELGCYLSEFDPLGNGVFSINIPRNYIFEQLFEFDNRYNDDCQVCWYFTHSGSSLLADYLAIFTGGQGNPVNTTGGGVQEGKPLCGDSTGTRFCTTIGTIRALDGIPRLNVRINTNYTTNLEDPCLDGNPSGCCYDQNPAAGLDNDVRLICNLIARP